MPEGNSNGGFFQVSNTLIDQIGERLGPHACWVYVVLLRHADNEGKCWPTHATLVKKSGLSRRTVIRALEVLEEAGLVRSETKPDRAANLYTLLGCATQAQPTAEVVPERHRGCATQAQGLCQTDTPVVPHRHTEEYPKNNTQEKDPKNNTPPNPRKRGNGAASEIAVWFNIEFWPNYPRHEGKSQALQELVRLKPDDAMRCNILAGLDRSRGSPQWKRDGGQYVPHARTWLHNRRWEDEITMDFNPAKNGHAPRRGLAEIQQEKLARLNAAQDQGR